MFGGSAVSDAIAEALRNVDDVRSGEGSTTHDDDARMIDDETETKVYTLFVSVVFNLVFDLDLFLLFRCCLASPLGSALHRTSYERVWVPSSDEVASRIGRTVPSERMRPNGEGCGCRVNRHVYTCARRMGGALLVGTSHVGP